MSGLQRELPVGGIGCYGTNLAYLMRLTAKFRRAATSQQWRCRLVLQEIFLFASSRFITIERLRFLVRSLINWSICND